MTGLTAERGANEAMSVALGWTNPATYNTGESLSIKQINIYRNDVLLKSLTDAASTASGAAVSLTDEVPASGYYTYGVEIVDANGKKVPRQACAQPTLGLSRQLPLPTHLISAM